MKTPTQDTLSLLKQLKHKRFSSQIPSQQYSSHIQPLIPSSSSYGFVCSYHPTEFVTNICLTSENPPKPLCPRCLQQHINSHTLTSSPTLCKLQSSDTEIHSIQSSLTQKLSSCDKLKTTITHLNLWQTIQLKQIISNLEHFRLSLLAQIEKEFISLQKQVKSRWQAHTKEYNQTVKRLEQTMGNLEDHCMRSLKLIGQRKQIDSICGSVSVINKKYQQLIRVQQKMLNSAMGRIQGKFSAGKMGQIVGMVKSSLQIGIGRVSGFEIDRIVKQVQMRLSKQQQRECGYNQKIGTTANDRTMAKLQKLFGVSTTTSQKRQRKKLFQIGEYNKQGDINRNMKERLFLPNKLQQQENENEQIDKSDKRVLSKLSDTGNRLKQSLNSIMKGTNTNTSSNNHHHEHRVYA